MAYRLCRLLGTKSSTGLSVFPITTTLNKLFCTFTDASTTASTASKDYSQSKMWNYVGPRGYDQVRLPLGDESNCGCMYYEYRLRKRVNYEKYVTKSALFALDRGNEMYDTNYKLVRVLQSYNSTCGSRTKIFLALEVTDDDGTTSQLFYTTLYFHRYMEDEENNRTLTHDLEASYTRRT